MNIKPTTMTALVLMAGFLTTPVMALANGNEKVDFCAMVVSDTFNPLVKMDERFPKMDERRMNRDATIDANRDYRDGKMTEKANILKNRLDAVINAKNQGTLTPEQQAAVAEFETSMGTTLATRDVELAELVADFRGDADSIRTEHRADIDALMVKARADFQVILDKARADCNAGIPSETVKSTFITSVKALHSDLQKERGVVKTDTKTDMQTVMRDHALERQALAERFSVSWKAGWAKLRAFFGGKHQAQLETEAQVQ